MAVVDGGEETSRTYRAFVEATHVWMEARAIPFLEHGHVREWFGVTFDISDRKCAELEVQRALELWTTTLRSIGDAVISTDASGCVRFIVRAPHLVIIPTGT